MRATSIQGNRLLVLAGIAAAAILASACGDVVRQGRAPVQVVIESLRAASGADPKEYGNTLFSDVITNVKRTVGGQEVEVPTVFADNGEVTMSLMLRDQSSPTAPSSVNQVTFNRYRVVYRRTDGRNTPGVDVPYPIDNGVTFTVPADGRVTAGFEIVRHVAKEDAPLMVLRRSEVVISTVAEVSFYGRDQAGNDVTATGTIGINFANFGDPQ